MYIEPYTVSALCLCLEVRASRDDLHQSTKYLIRCHVLKGACNHKTLLLIIALEPMFKQHEGVGDISVDDATKHAHNAVPVLSSMLTIPRVPLS